MAFDDRKYTEDSLRKQLGLIEAHVNDGSAIDAGCGCIEGKHLLLVEGYAEEGVRFALTDSEKKFYDGLANWARANRKKIEMAEWDVHGHSTECVHCENLRGHERKECFKACHV